MTLIEMCKFYDPLVPRKCLVGKYGSLRCHSRRSDCIDYKPSYRKEANNGQDCTCIHRRP